MSDLTDLYQEYLDKDETERNEIASLAAEEIFEFLEESYDEEDVLDIFVSLFAVLCSVDGVINQAEYELFKYVSGIDVPYDEFYEVMKNGTNQDLIDQVAGVIEDEGEDFASAVFVLALCVFTSNGTMTVAEQEFIDTYL